MNCKRWDILVVDLAGNANDEMKTIGGIVKDWELVSVVSLPFCRRAYLKREAGKASEVKREIPDSTANPLDDAIARVQLGTKARAQHTDAPPAVELTEEQRIGISACETGM